MEKTVTNKRKAMTLSETKKVIHDDAIAAWLKWSDELEWDFLPEIEFFLSLKGRWLLCHMGKEYPYTIRFRLMWERDYQKSKPEEFITLAKQKLLH